MSTAHKSYQTNKSITVANKHDKVKRRDKANKRGKVNQCNNDCIRVDVKNILIVHCTMYLYCTMYTVQYQYIHKPLL